MQSQRRTRLSGSEILPSFHPGIYRAGKICQSLSWLPGQGDNPFRKRKKYHLFALQSPPHPCRIIEFRFIFRIPIGLRGKFHVQMYCKTHPNHHKFIYKPPTQIGELSDVGHVQPLGPHWDYGMVMCSFHCCKQYRFKWYYRSKETFNYVWSGHYIYLFRQAMNILEYYYKG